MRAPRNKFLDLTSQLIFRKTTAQEVWPLRHAVLRSGLMLDTAKFDGDFNRTTRHFGAFHDTDLLCCLSLFHSTWSDTNAWQVRGMATAPTHQRQGIGKILLRYAINMAHDENPEWPFWCNARTTAIGFYEQVDWSVETDIFDIPTAGPHVRMYYCRE